MVGGVFGSFAGRAACSLAGVKISTVRFVTSAVGPEGCPPEERPEFAFVGRSNVGKSSLINGLVGRKGLARVSATPGATQLINFFEVDGRWSLVDLPGYGYSKTPKSVREGFREMVSGYLNGRESLQVVFVLIDARHDPQAIDLEFCEWLAAAGLPFVLLFTKTDKVKPNRAAANRTAFLDELAARIGARPRAFATSATTGAGRGEVLGFIEEILRA